MVYAVVLVLCLLPGQGFDASDDDTPLYAITIAGSLIAALAGTAAGAWQARAGGVRAPGAGLGAAAATVVVAGVLLTAANGGTSNAGNVLIYLAHPVGAAIGAVLYGRRWLATVR